ncbi:MAG: protein kinase [Candidatus Latescibacteria bacterium]|nr:protein kinase [bacterium]MBD3423065.1 protein kinase [Candidatus Latescibacterota bacterium]
MQTESGKDKESIWKLPEDIVINPVEELPDGFLEKFAEEGDVPVGSYGIQRKGVRAHPKIVNQDVVDVLRRFGSEGATYREVLEHFVRERELDREKLHPGMKKMVKTFIKSNYLVPVQNDKESSGDSVTPSIPDGEKWLSYRVMENVRCIIDSEIYRVENEETGEPGALKISRANLASEESNRKIINRLHNEFSIMSLLDHPNILKVIEHGTHRDRKFGILEWADGPNVRSYAYRSDKPPTERKLINLAGQCLRALSAVHRAGFIHGDVHTGNFLIRNGSVRLIDFGLSRPVELPPGMEKDIVEGGVLHYMPPEYVHHTMEKRKGLWGSVAGEIYSCGIIMFALFTRHYPYRWSFYRKDYLKKIIKDPPLSFEETGAASRPQLEKVIRKAISKNPADRFSSVEEMISALESVPSTDMVIAHRNRKQERKND